MPACHAPGGGFPRGSILPLDVPTSGLDNAPFHGAIMGLVRDMAMATLNPVGILKRGMRAALRRRYGYAALRVMRASLRRALRVHRERMLDPARPYSGTMDEISAQYRYAMRRVLKRWPMLDYLDQRAEP